jgi:hypothetical protein
MPMTNGSPGSPLRERSETIGLLLQLITSASPSHPMTFKEHLLQELEHTPEPILEQVLNFLQFLKAHSPNNGTSIQTPTINRSAPDLSDQERLAKLNKLFGAWKDQPDLAEKFAEIDRERHAYRGRPIDSMDR